MAVQPMPGMPHVTVERDVPSRMRDGVTLYADVYRPAEEGPYPVILMRTPYGKEAAESNFGYTHPSWYARQGYVVVVQDTRGRWTSEGDFYPFRDEAEDGYDTIEWAARLPGADGRVGMYGFSYVGATQLLPAALRPPSLAAICPAFTGSQYYEGWTYKQGALSLAFAASWAAFLALDTAKRRRDDEALAALGTALLGAESWYWSLPLTTWPPLANGDAPYFYDWLAHPTYDDYWRRWSTDEDYGRLQVPALHIGGWYDVFAAGTVKNFVGMRAGAGDARTREAQKLLIGPWYHMPWQPVGWQGDADAEAGPNVVDDWELRWFDHFLKGRENGVLDSPVTVFVMGDGWRDFDAWPPSSARATDYFLHSDGRANSSLGDGALSMDAPGDEPADVYTYDPDIPQPSLGGHSCCLTAITPMGPACQEEAERTKNVLVYTTAPLERELDIVGDVTVTVYAASTAPDTDFTARLCVVPENGCSTNLLEGIVRARFRDSLTDPTLIAPGEVYEYRIELGPIGARVAAGARLRLDISSSDFPQWDRNLNTGGPPGGEPASAAVVATQVVLHDRAHPSRVTLPVLA